VVSKRAVKLPRARDRNKKVGHKVAVLVRKAACLHGEHQASILKKAAMRRRIIPSLMQTRAVITKVVTTTALWKKPVRRKKSVPRFDLEKTRFLRIDSFPS